MNNLEIFKNKKFGEVRVVQINNEPWFVAKDICNGLDIKNTTQAVKRLDEDERTMLNIGRQGETNFVNEYGFYNLVLVSRKDEAKEFKRWITHDVIPTIRKTGGYVNNDELFIDTYLPFVDEQTKMMFRETLKTVRVLNKEVDRLQVENLQQEQLIGELKPKADYTDLILNNPNTMCTTTIAKDYGMTSQEFNLRLNAIGIQYKRDNQWFLYKNYQNMGYTQSQTLPYQKPHTEWTQKGRLFLYNVLKERGIYPLIEQGYEQQELGI